MRAAVLTAHGGNEVVHVSERQEPAARAGEVIVRMRSVTLNRADLYMRNSGKGVNHSLPQIMGLDGVGIVEKVADESSGLRPGQRVAIYPATSCGTCESCRRGEALFCSSIRYFGEQRDGTLAELVSVPLANAVPIPDELDDGSAAALGVAYLTAWRMLFTRACLKPSETVLIFGLGGISVAALQLAKTIGAQTIVTSRDQEKRALAKGLGADHAIDADADIVSEVMAITGKRGVDVVIENVGEQIWPVALRSLRRGGRLILCGATTGGAPSAELHRLFVRQLSVIGSTLGTPAEFRDLLQLCGRGAFRPVIGGRYSLDDIHLAMDDLEAEKQRTLRNCRCDFGLTRGPHFLKLNLIHHRRDGHTLIELVLTRTAFQASRKLV
jgi:NADPH:quinone reductase-like Zn-dependent oxidoreductase